MGGPAATSIGVLRGIFADRFARSFAVQLWDGTRIGPGDAAFTLLVNSPSALRSAFLPPIDLNPGRAFVAGLLDIDGDIVTAVDTIGRALGALPKSAIPAIFANLLPLAQTPSMVVPGEMKLAANLIRANATLRRSAFTTISRSRSTNPFSTRRWCIRARIIANRR